MTVAGGAVAARPQPGRVALLGNPNTGKTSLFNRLCGLRAHVANYPGVTVDARIGRARWGEGTAELIDLPGVYSLSLEVPESRLCRGLLAGTLGEPPPDAVLVVVDASHLERNLTLLGEVLGTGLPTAVALSMGDVASKRGRTVDPAALERELGVPVVPVNPRLGVGSAAVLDSLSRARRRDAGTELTGQRESIERWAHDVASRVVVEAPGRPDRLTDPLDRALTHPVGGLAAFLLTMAGLFAAIRWIAQYPMDWIETIFAAAQGALAAGLPPGAVRELLTDGVVGGIAGTVVFIPQIALLFFLLTLLEDSGYLARAAFVANRLLRPFGLPGQAFVPLLSSHACAIPGILCTRLIPDRRDRLATILVAPFLSCSARIPVYVLLTGVLFPDDPGRAGLAFAGCYLLGGAAALGAGLLYRRTLLRGRSRPLVLELPPYHRPSLRNALSTAFERSRTFVVKAGTVILGICIVLWWLSHYPRTAEGPEVLDLRRRAAALETSEPARAAELADAANRLAGREGLAHSFSGRIGRAVEPVFEPIGADWQLSIAILSSFAAREVFVSSLLVTLGAGDEEVETSRVIATVERARRDDGSPLLPLPDAAGLLVFYVLAMQCLPTLAVTRREAGGWRWAALQFGSMSALAWIAAVATRVLVATLTGGSG